MKPRIIIGLALLVTVVMAACADEGEEPVHAGVASLEVAASKPCQLTELISANELGSSERAAITADGRLFIIGTRVSALSVPTPTENFGSFVFEVKHDGSAYVLLEYVAASLEGTADGKVGSAPRGAECLFSGLTVHGSILYAGCTTLDGAASLVQIDTQQQTVRAGGFTSCNFEPAAGLCKPSQIAPNGMAVDGAGRIYVSNMESASHAASLLRDSSTSSL